MEDPKKFPIVKQNGGLIKQNHIIQLPIETSKMRLNFTNSLPPLEIVRSLLLDMESGYVLKMVFETQKSEVQFVSASIE